MRYGRNNYRCVNCAGWGEDTDNANDPDGDWDTSDYQAGRPMSQVNFDEDNSASCEIEVGCIGNWQPDSDVGHYLVNRSVSGDYRDAGRTDDCGASESFAESNIVRNLRGRKGRSV